MVGMSGMGRIANDKRIETKGKEMIQELGLAGAMTRRRFVRLALGTGAVAAAGVAGVSLGGGLASADYTGFYRTSTAVNLRTGPSTRRRVLKVIPAIAMVSDLGLALENGYRYVAF